MPKGRKRRKKGSRGKRLQRQLAAIRGWVAARVSCVRWARALAFAAGALLGLALFAPGLRPLQPLARALCALCGWAAYLVPPLLLALSSSRLRERLPLRAAQAGGALLATWMALALTHLALRLPNPAVLAVGGYGGGLLGWSLAAPLGAALGRPGAALVLGTGLFGALLLTFRRSPAEVFALARARLPRLQPRAVPAKRPRVPARRALSAPTQARQALRMELAPPAPSEPRPQEPAPASCAVAPASAEAQASPCAAPEAKGRDKGPGEPQAEAAAEAGAQASSSGGWKLPDPRAILRLEAEEVSQNNLVQERARIIEETLASLGVPAEVVEAQQGPAVTLFAVRPGWLEKRSPDGTLRRLRVRVHKVATLADDLALALSAAPVRIQAPIPGRSLIGIEVPNPQAQVVPLGSVFLSGEFQRLSSPLALALGRDIAGRPLVADLARMPHLLMAGATGSGKSVCINSIIACLLLRNTPEQLRLILIDPKRVELGAYRGLPHLIGTVVCEADRAVAALQWATREMDRRYARIAEAGARDLRGYNARVKKEGGEELPRIVIVIDELADLMMRSPYEVEKALCRLAQMARATGIHLVVATQRPSVDVVTGLIKANFPARIAFAVSSQVDSRVIIDSPGAERLLGRGDMLYMPPTGGRLVRAQGCYVSDEEIAALVQYWLAAAGEGPASAHVQGELWEHKGSGQAEDPLLAEAIALAQREGRASTTLLQRHLRIGYNRAARLMDALVARGVVSAEADGPYGSHSLLAAAAGPAQGSREYESST